MGLSDHGRLRVLPTGLDIRLIYSEGSASTITHISLVVLRGS